MKKSSPSSVSLAKLSNIWKRREIFPINTLLAAQCHHLPPPRNPPALERNPLCVCNLYPAHRPNPSSSLFQLIPPSALLLLQTQESVTYRIEGGEAVLVCEHIGEFPAAPVPISHKLVTAGAGHICKGTPGCDWPHQSCPHQPTFDFWIPSSCSPWTCAWGEGVCLPALMLQSSSLPAALTQHLCPTGLSPGKVLAPLTLLPVAERIPGLAQVASGTIVHNAHMVGPTAGVGVGCGVSSCAIVQPTHQAQMESHLEEENQ